MLQFIKDAVRELRHVVWPTKKETQKFFWLTLLLLIVFGIYLFVFSQIFSETLFALKEIFWTWQSTSTPADINVSDIFIDEEVIQEESVFSEDMMLSPEMEGESTSVEELTSPQWDTVQE